MFSHGEIGKLVHNRIQVIQLVVRISNNLPLVVVVVVVVVVTTIIITKQQQQQQ